MDETNQITAAELDRKVDEGEDISAHLDWKQARRPGREELAQLLRGTRDRLLEEVRRLDRAIDQIER